MAFEKLYRNTLKQLSPMQNTTLRGIPKNSLKILITVGVFFSFPFFFVKKYSEQFNKPCSLIEESLKRRES